MGGFFLSITIALACQARVAFFFQTDARRSHVSLILGCQVGAVSRRELLSVFHTAMVVLALLVFYYDLTYKIAPHEKTI